jgi:hypothetical protein
MHQTSEGHVDSTRFSSFPQVDLSPLARLSHAALTQHSQSSVRQTPQRLEIGGMALEHSNVACSISTSDTQPYVT